MIFLTVLAALTLLAVTAGSLEMAWGNRRVPFLARLPVTSQTPWPKISIVIPARNEERNIASALASVLRMDYEPLEVLVVNDRSTDSTGKILADLAARYPRLRPLDVQQLPEGWIGKNHALAYGASQAIGEWILFADADVVMDPSTLKRAMAYALEKKRDHVAVIPDLALQGFWLTLFASCFTMFFSAYYKPWKVSQPKSSSFVGIGAFNLMKRSVYDAVGGHARIALRPDDDLMLGKLVKRAGYAQDLLYGQHMLSVEWYASTREMVNGLMKNAFSGANYSILLNVFFTFAVVAVYIWPFLAIVLTQGRLWALNMAIVTVELALFYDTTRFLGYRKWIAFTVPIGALFMIYIMWRAMLLNLREGGIRWRGTFYSLDALKKNKV